MKAQTRAGCERASERASGPSQHQQAELKIREAAGEGEEEAAAAAAAETTRQAGARTA